MDRDGLKIGVLISQNDAGLDWWTEDEILQELTAIILHVHFFCRGGGFFKKYIPLILNKQNVSWKRVLFRKKRTMEEQNGSLRVMKKKVDFLLNEQIFLMILK